MDNYIYHFNIDYLLDNSYDEDILYKFCKNFKNRVIFRTFNINNKYFINELKFDLNYIINGKIKYDIEKLNYVNENIFFDSFLIIEEIEFKKIEFFNILYKEIKSLKYLHNIFKSSLDLKLLYLKKLNITNKKSYLLEFLYNKIKINENNEIIIYEYFKFIEMVDMNFFIIDDFNSRNINTINIFGELEKCGMPIYYFKKTHIFFNDKKYINNLAFNKNDEHIKIEEIENIKNYM